MVSRAQLRPPSTDLNSPADLGIPLAPLNRFPVPMYTMSGSTGSSDTAPIAVAGNWSVIGRQLVPPSVLFHSPPLPAAA